MGPRDANALDQPIGSEYCRRSPESQMPIHPDPHRQRSRGVVSVCGEGYNWWFPAGPADDLVTDPFLSGPGWPDCDEGGLRRMRPSTHVGILLAAAIFLAACTAPAQPPGASPARPVPEAQRPPGPKRITAAVVSNVPTLVDRLAAGGVGVPGLPDLERLISPGLTIADAQGALRPLLAEAAPTTENGLWRVFPDGRMETTWRIKAGALWHDGAPFTGEDVLFTSAIDRDTDLAIRRTIAYASVESVGSPDLQTVTVTWRRPYIQADALFNSPLLPRHLLEKAYTEDKTSFTQLPYWTEDYVGTGPFKLRQFVRGSHMVLEANDRYVLGRPKIDEIEIKFIPDPNTLMANVLAGAVELTLGRGISLEQALQVRDQWRDGKVDISFTSWLVIYPQFLNPNPAVVGELQFRRALMHATDRQQMAESLQAGLVPVAHTFLHPNEPEYQDVAGAIVGYEFDPRRATQLIEALGYTKGTDGLFRDSANQRLNVEIRTSPEQDIQVKTIFVLADYWQRVGVGVEPTVMAEQRVRDREYVQTFPAFLMYRQPNDPRSLLLRLYSAQTPLPETNFVGRNHPRYMNAEFDALLDLYYTTIPRRERTKVLGAIINHTTDRLTLMGLFYDTEPVFIGNRLEHVSAARASDSTPVWNADLWGIRS